MKTCPTCGRVLREPRTDMQRRRVITSSQQFRDMVVAHTIKMTNEGHEGFGHCACADAVAIRALLGEPRLVLDGGVLRAPETPEEFEP